MAQGTVSTVADELVGGMNIAPMGIVLVEGIYTTEQS
jgi:hypothetical protein